MVPAVNGETIHAGNGANGSGPFPPGADSTGIPLPGMPITHRVLVAMGVRASTGDTREWEKSNLAQTEVDRIQTPAQRYPIKPWQPSGQFIYDQFVRTQRELGALVDHNSSPVYEEARQALDWVLRRAGYEPGDMRLDIIRSPAENAFIMHHDDIDTPHIFITTGFLRMLQDRLPKGLRQGHLRFIFGHEVGHFREGHYDQIKGHEERPKAPDRGDPIVVRHIWGQFSMDSLKDYFFSMAFTRDQELVVDELGLRWSADPMEEGCKVNPVEGVEVLDFLAEAAEEHRQKLAQQEGKNRARFPLLSWAANTLSASHPGSAGRAAIGRGVVRQIEVELAGAAGVLASRRRWKMTEKTTKPSQDRELNLTQVQSTLVELNRLTEGVPIGERAPLEDIETFVRGRIDHYSVDNYEQSLEEIKHLAAFIPAFVRTHERCVPFQPYDPLNKFRGDVKNAGLSQGMEKQPREQLDQIMDLLAEAVQSLNRRAVSDAEASGPAAVADVNLRAYFALGGMFESEWGHRILMDGAVPALVESPLEAIRLINQHGEQFFDYKGISNEWNRALLESNDDVIEQRGVFYARLIEDERIDLRAQLFRTLLDNSLLDSIESVADLLEFIEQCEATFGGDPAWIEGDIPRLLGQEISMWLLINFDTPTPLTDPGLQDAIAQLRDRATAPVDGADEILIEAVALCLEQEAGELSERKKWVADTFSPGIQRDLILCRLIEEETGHFGRARTSLYKPEKPKATARADDDSAKKNSKRTSHPHEGLEVEKMTLTERGQYYEVVGEVIELFDCNWIELSLVRGALVSFQGEAPWNLLGFEPGAHGPLHEATPVPLHSPMLSRFANSYPYAMMGPNNRAMNTMRYYLRPFADLCVLGCTDENYHVAQRPNSGSNLELTSEEINNHFNHGALYRIIADLPRQYHFPLQIGGEGEQASPVASSLDGRAAAVEKDARLNSFIRARYLQPLEFKAHLIAGRHIDQYRFKSVMDAVAELPEGEFRDFLVLRELGFETAQQSLALACREVTDEKLTDRDVDPTLCSQELVNALYQKLERADGIFLNNQGRGGGNRPAPAPDSKLDSLKAALKLLRQPETLEKTAEYKLTGTGTEHAYKLELLAQLYEDYPRYLKFKSGVLNTELGIDQAEVAFFNLQDVATEIGRMAMQCYHGASNDTAAAFQELTPIEKLAEIEEIFIYNSSERDSHLMRILREAEAAGPDFYRSAMARRIYSLFYSPYHQAEVGERIYSAELAAEPGITQDFDRHIALILETHPAGSARRERRLKAFFDGRAGGERASVRTWAQRDQVVQLLDDEQSTTADEDKLLRKGGVQFLEAAVNELNVSAKERVDTILFLAGLREKSHLVNCYEALEGVSTSELNDELERLTDDEKKILIRGVLVGPQGVLKTDDAPAKKEFLDTLFFSVFRDASDERTEQNVRYFKAVYDTMLYHIEPERAADFLGNFLVAHLDGESFNQQVKVFFESFGFVGVKTAQYLVSSTTMIPPDMKEVLMDLTSRVDGPDCRCVFDLAEATYGPDAREIIAEIGDRVGGGSLMSFYEVKLTDGREGVLGILRPDIVQALPEDIVLVNRLIQTMQEAPEVFGGNTVTEDLNDNLVYMSLVETDLQRTIKLQKRMRRQIVDPSGDPAVCVPAIWEKIRIGSDDRSVKLNQGPFIFMERAQGQTLDLFMAECSDDERRAVKNKVAEVFLDQVTEHGLIHCDLHPGNILVHRDESGGLHVTFLDIGLSTELDNDVSTAIGRYLRIAVGHTEATDSITSGTVGRAVRRFFGVGEINPDTGRRWVRDSLELFEQLLDENWDEELLEQATDTVWDIVSDNDQPVQAKLAQTMDLTRQLGLNFPREFYYILRAVSIMDYIWEEVDWNQQRGRIRDLGGDAAETAQLPELDEDTIWESIETAAEQVGLEADESRVRDIIRSVNNESDLSVQLQQLRDGLIEIVEGQEDEMRQLFRELADDENFRDELGLGQVSDQLQKFFSYQEGERTRAAKKDFGFLAPDPLPAGMARTVAYDNQFGSLSSVWKMNFYPGIPVRVVDTETGTKVRGRYIITASNSIHDRPEELEVSEQHDHDDYDNYCFHAETVFAEDKATKPASVIEEWRSALRPIDSFLDRLASVKDGERVHRMQQFEKKTDAGGARVTPWDIYQTFFMKLTDREMTRETTKLGKVVREQTAKEQNTIQIMVAGEWTKIDDCLLQAGETPAEYLQFMTDTRRELGLVAAD